MRDVARLAGVSVATVSAVINDTVTVSEKRRERVRQAMAAIDYSPDQIARSLRVGRSGVIGMVIPDVTNAFFPEVIRGVEDSARREGYSVILCNSNEDPEQEERHLDMLGGRRVDGVLLACTNNAAAYDRLLRRRFPIVFFDRIPDITHHGAVGTDNLDASYQATKHLLQQGHRRIGFIAGNLLLSPHARRLEGFRKAMSGAGIPVKDEYLQFGDLQLESGYRSGLHLLSLAHPPTAIISSSSKMLLGLLRAMRELEVRCPAQVSVIGFDDHVWSEFFHPPLTCVSQPSYEIGRRAFEMLLKRLQKHYETTQTEGPVVLLKAELRVRESTASPVRQKVSANRSRKPAVRSVGRKGR
jgi:LacI family transcriptional regulator